jgi:hypothetical protein
MSVHNAELAALEAMAIKAGMLRLRGVAVILTVPGWGSDQWDPQVRAVGNIVDTPATATDGNPAGINYWAVAMSRVAEMIETGRHSGTSGQPPRLGILGDVGGIVYDRHGLRIYLAFAGSEPVKDIDVVKAGWATVNDALDRVLDEQTEMMDQLRAAILAFARNPTESEPPKRKPYARRGWDD